MQLAAADRQRMELEKARLEDQLADVIFYPYSQRIWHWPGGP
jgi:hypothetical protein